MNKNSLAILAELREAPGITQRELAKALALSPSAINQHLQQMREQGLIIGEGRDKQISEKGVAEMEKYRVKNAVILTSSPGILFLPQENCTPKGLVVVRGEPMVERQIKQLNEVGIKDITLVVGYRKEQFEYLIDLYGVKLLLLPDFMDRNALSSVYHARSLLKNTYIIHGDHYMEGNPFQPYDCEAWYGDVRRDTGSGEWHVVPDARGRIRNIVVGGAGGRVLLGPAHFTEEFSQAFTPYLEASAHDPKYYQSPWEIVLLENLPKLPEFRVRSMQGVYKLSTLESLCEFDPAYRDKTEDQAREIISSYFNISVDQVGEMGRTADGMNNASFIFGVDGRRYLLRIPYPGGNDVVNRREEYNCYSTLQGENLIDEPIYFDPETGIKMAPFFEDCHNMDPANDREVKSVMAALRRLHNSGKVFDHSIDHLEIINAYERLSLENGDIPYRDYNTVKGAILRLLEDVRAMDRPFVCCHNDAAPVNFLILPDGEVKIIDWEYGGMGDPFNDIASQAIYTFYDPTQVKKLLTAYLERDPTHEELACIYAKMAIYGFAWSLWTVYKSNLGQDFGEYGIMNYRCAKVFSRWARALLDGSDDMPEWSVPIITGI